MAFISQSTFNRRDARRSATFLAAALLGILADQIIRTPGRPGLNVASWAVAGAIALWLLAHGRDNAASRETKLLISGALFFAALLALRDAEALAVFCLFSAILLLGLAAGRAAQAWATRAYILDIAAAAVRVIGLMLAGPFGWSIGTTPQEAAAASSNARTWSRHARIVARGTVMALPPLLILTALLTSADPVFERVLHNALFTKIQPLVQHLAFAGAVAWFTSGYLRAFLIPDDVVIEGFRLPRPAIAAAEISVALSLLNVLFVAFMIVQVRYLFGGASLIEVTKGLTYSEYARRGFFELVFATALAIPLLLAADWAADRDEVHSRRVLRVTSAVLVLLLAGVLASAAYRMWLYQGAYGLTEDRVYGSMVIVWLTCVLALFAGTVLRGRRRGFVFGALIAGVACIAALHIVNPHALIARVNISRAAAGAEVDGRYLRTLSADAVPTLIAQLPGLPVEERCRVGTMLKKRWSGERSGGWRTWNLGDARARGLVKQMSSVAGCVTSK